MSSDDAEIGRKSRLYHWMNEPLYVRLGRTAYPARPRLQAAEHH